MRSTLLLILSGLLAACGNPNRDAADACMAEIRGRLADKSIKVDVDRLAESATPTGTATALTAPIVFDPGLASEYTQQIECRVREENGQPTVIFLQFDWNIDDMRKSQ
ncbi:MAG TPA: hypothetical protein PKO41_01585 [Dokdonella sp.]|uniref:hypothetical protein n=1 Tax=Dokdonella sp. TaxID=2291710 RepID=UPI0025BC7CB5|nr:hypothetical protein [Dokdonella sp.]MBX3690941.1 hypothetical protein [Dokdonella sp.]MCW5566794.1 hypothetical protein [Dokdonella sp.]HNR91092.1 hypothetical protein [Dokdonella sp.]